MPLDDPPSNELSGSHRAGDGSSGEGAGNLPMDRDSFSAEEDETFQAPLIELDSTRRRAFLSESHSSLQILPDAVISDPDHSCSTNVPLRPARSERTGPINRPAGVAAGTDDSLLWSFGGNSLAGIGVSRPGRKRDRGIPRLPPQIGDYEIDSLIGSGGMGHVFRAKHVRMQRVVALKVLPDELMGDAVSIERFYDEVRAAGRLMHPNIVTALDAGDHQGIHYLVMEFVDGVTLSSLIEQTGPATVGAAAGMIRQAAMGLLHAHRSGLIHRDVKPSNIMRSIDGSIKILDLGLARVHTQGESQLSTGQLSNADEDQHLIGTLAYMSPEQLESAAGVDFRTDIYSLGATLHFLLTGRSPYAGPYIDQVYGHRHGKIPDLMSLRDDVDLHFANIFERMMAKSPDTRFQSFDEVVQSLAPYATESDAPSWLTEFTGRQSLSDNSTFSSGSSLKASQSVLGIELGMFHAAAAECAADGSMADLDLSGGMANSVSDSGSRHVFRCIIASDDSGVCLDQDASRRRSTEPASVVHCLMLYIGRKWVPRSVAGRQCPPEALLGLILRTIAQRGWPEENPPAAVALTVLASYDQMHRRCLVQAASIAGFPAVRLIDRSLACTTAVLAGLHESSRTGSSPTDLLADIAVSSVYRNDPNLGDSSTSLLHGPPTVSRRNLLYVGLSGQGTETALLRVENDRLKQLATAGHWNNGSLVWLGRLVEMSVDLFQKQYQFNPRFRLADATQLQMSCEKAMLSMAVLPTASITIGNRRIELRRDAWLMQCQDLMKQLQGSVRTVIKQSQLSWKEIDLCILYGPLLRMPKIREFVLSGLGPQVKRTHVDRDAAARGAAMCLSAQLPGRTNHPTPPRAAAGQTLGLVIADAKHRRRILPLIRRGTIVPTRVNRRVAAMKGRETMTITLAESSGIDGRSWQTLGKDEIELQSDSNGSTSRSLGFEVDINGLLSIRIQGVGGPGSTKLPDLPPPNLDDIQIQAWQRWTAGIVGG